jgi:hypothetical protein
MIQRAMSFRELQHMKKRIIILTIALLLTGHALLFYALSPKILILVLVAFTVLYIKIKWQEAITLSVTLALVTLVLAVAMEALITEEKTIYYRPHEMFVQSDGRYKKNVRFEMAMPHGDLKAMALYTEVVPEPRKVVFNTDSLGFRGSDEYQGQKYLFVGDSFIVGNGSSQSDIITAQLSERHKISAYNLAFPGNIEVYYNNVQSFRKLAAQDAKVILFLFEGNDFPLNTTENPIIVPPNTAKINPVVNALKNYYKLFSSTDMYRYMYSTSRRIIATNIKKEKERVVVHTIGELPVAFYKEYITVTERDILPENSQTELYLSEMKDDIEHIFFIPTKYRVYYNYINGHKQKNSQDLPDRQWQFIQAIGQKFDIPTTNLTPALIEESDKLLEQGVLTFWRDDTHWNKYGIAIAADIVNQELVSQH